MGYKRGKSLFSLLCNAIMNSPFNLAGKNENCLYQTVSIELVRKGSVLCEVFNGSQTKVVAIALVL